MESINSPRKPWVAGLLTFFCIGLGHLYIGNPKRAAFLFCGKLVVLLCAYLCLLFYPPIGQSLAIAIALFYVYFCVVDAVKRAHRLSGSYPLKRVNRWYWYLSVYILVGLMITPGYHSAVRRYVAQTFRISSGSMRPTLLIGDRVVTSRLQYCLSQPQRIDLVVFPHPEDPAKTYLKRVVGLGGETIEIRNKQVLIDGRPLDEPYAVHVDGRIISAMVAPRDNLAAMTIPADALFLMGDNRDQSYDSRFFGVVARDAVAGKVASIYWSWDRDAFRVRWNRLGKTIE